MEFGVLCAAIGGQEFPAEQTRVNQYITAKGERDAQSLGSMSVDTQLRFSMLFFPLTSTASGLYCVAQSAEGFAS